MLERLLICTDLDRTLLPNGSQPESVQARPCFARLAARPEATLVYVSGRHLALVMEAIRDYQLPSPDWIIGDVGTTLYQADNGGWRHWQAWEDEIAPDWRGLDSTQLRPLFAELPGLRLQEEAKQNRHKLSYYLPLKADAETLQTEMSQRLKTEGLAANLIYSIDQAEGIALLDLLPASANKLHAVQFLMQQQGFDNGNTVFAGDSGNDLPVIVSPVPSILVANTDPEVVQQAYTLAKQQGTLAAFYHAQGGFLRMNGNYAAGILEGAAYYHEDIRLWLETKCKPRE